MGDTSELANNLVQARENLEELWDGTDDKPTLKQIGGQITSLNVQIMRLISANINDADATYASATKALADANTDLSKAIDDQNAIDGAIDAIAQALKLVAQVAAVAA